MEAVMYYNYIRQQLLVMFFNFIVAVHHKDSHIDQCRLNVVFRGPEPGTSPRASGRRSMESWLKRKQKSNLKKSLRFTSKRTALCINSCSLAYHFYYFA